jgi:3-oxoacyl-[acyl-carrier protein] reductase
MDASSALADKVALVTGSSQGIGAAIATLFARHGAKVAVHGRDAARLATVESDIGKAGGTAMTVSGDVRRSADIEDMRRRIESELGPVDVLVANAGGNPVPPGPLEQITEDGWRATLDENLTATFLTLKAFVPGMRERRRGSIITISSAAARRPHPHSPIPYAAAKAGIQMLTQHLAAQLGPDGIRVNCLAPETILTESNSARIPVALQRTLAQAHSVQRLGVPDDVAYAALFLASEQAAWITGVILDISGGGVMS